MDTLKTESRSLSEKAKRLRREGYVTGSVFGKEIDGSLLVKMNKKDVEHLLKTNGKGSRVALDLNGEKKDVLIKEVDFDPMKGAVLELSFQALVSGEMVHSVAEVVVVNQESVVSGVAEQHLNEISYRALPEALVDKVTVDVTGLNAGDTVKVGDLPIASDKKVHLMTPLDTVVVSVGYGHQVEETSDDDADASAAPAAETKSDNQ